MCFPPGLEVTQHTGVVSGVLHIIWLFHMLQQERRNDIDMESWLHFYTPTPLHPYGDSGRQPGSLGSPRSAVTLEQEEEGGPGSPWDLDYVGEGYGGIGRQPCPARSWSRSRTPQEFDKSDDRSVWPPLGVA